MTQELNAKAMGFSVALISTACMLLLGIFGNLGIYIGAVNMMQQLHLFFSLSLLGIIGGMIEAAIISFVVTYIIVYFYNKFI